MRREGNFWKEEILTALSALGGKGSLQEIYRWFELNSNLTSQEMTAWGGVGPMYQHTIRSYLTQMVRDGQVMRIARAVYCLSGTSRTV